MWTTSRTRTRLCPVLQPNCHSLYLVSHELNHRYPFCLRLDECVIYILYTQSFQSQN